MRNTRHYSFFHQIFVSAMNKDSTPIEA